jgi:predicted SAM-dependent methyltransferase
MLDTVQKKLDQLEPVRLHLGCGGRLLDGYLNIDGAYMQGTPGITIHDLMDKFPLPDNCVDEILSVHVIEHIMPDKVPDLMKEWLRILKPGGFVATEWPDLLKMCKFIVEDPSRMYSDNGKIQKRAVAGIFGNIVRYQDSVMLHKWGYSAESMSVLLQKNGFARTVTEKPHHQKTEMCSRVVAYK